jgi:hypothetical protein
MQPEHSDPAWPYNDYPALLPYARMKEARRLPMEPEAFAETHIHHGIPELTNAELCVVVPPISNVWSFHVGPIG